MYQSLTNARSREELIERLDRLSPDAAPLWGSMTPHRMLAHLADWMLMASGDIKTAPVKHLLRHPPFKQLAIYWLPFPRGVMTSPELLARKPAAWDVERAAIRERVQAYEKLDPKAKWPEHPVFGRMSARAWCVFAYRHMDHHLRQFGV